MKDIIYDAGHIGGCTGYTGTTYKPETLMAEFREIQELSGAIEKCAFEIKRRLFGEEKCVGRDVVESNSFFDELKMLKAILADIHTNLQSILERF